MGYISALSSGMTSPTGQPARAIPYTPVLYNALACSAAELDRHCRSKHIDIHCGSYMCTFIVANFTS